jgi:hypothetical protein
MAERFAPASVFRVPYIVPSVQKTGFRILNKAPLNYRLIINLDEPEPVIPDFTLGRAGTVVVGLRGFYGTDTAPQRRGGREQGGGLAAVKMLDRHCA